MFNVKTHKLDFRKMFFFLVNVFKIKRVYIQYLRVSVPFLVSIPNVFLPNSEKPLIVTTAPENDYK